MTSLLLSDELIIEANAREIDALEEDYAALGRQLARTDIAKCLVDLATTRPK